MTLDQKGDRLRAIRIGVAMRLEEFCSVRLRMVGESVEATESINLGVCDPPLATRNAVRLDMCLNRIITNIMMYLPRWEALAGHPSPQIGAER